MHQILAGGEALPIAAQLQGVGTEVVGDIAQRVVRVVGHQTMEAILSAESDHFLMMVLDALSNLQAGVERHSWRDTGFRCAVHG